MKRVELAGDGRAGRRAWTVGACCVATLVISGQFPIAATARLSGQEPPTQPGPPAGCRVTGRVLSGAEPLPGAAVVVSSGGNVKAATSTGVDGRFTILFGPNATYHVIAELTAFTKEERDLTFGPIPCDSTLEFQLALRPRAEPLDQPADSAGVPAQASTSPAGAQAPAPVASGQTAGLVSAPPQGRATGAGRGQGSGRAGAAAQAGPRFQQLNVQEDESGSVAADAAPPDASGDVARFLPAGFSLQSAQSDAVAISGSADAMSFDRSAMNDRMLAIGRGEFDPATGQFAQGFGPQAGAGGDNLPGGQAAGGRGGRGGDGGGGGRGGFGGGPGGFVLGGRGGRGQSLFQGSANYSYGGSALDATNLQPRNGRITPVAQLPFNRNNFGGTIGGPVKIPGLYADANRRTNFQLNYSGNHSTQLQDCT